MPVLEPHDPGRPVVCFDETSTQLLAETRPSLPPQPGVPLRQLRVPAGGNPQPVLGLEPLAGWRHVAVTQRRTMQDFAHRMRWLVDHVPEAQVVRVVLDNLNISPGVAVRDLPGRRGPDGSQKVGVSLYPQHASWLNMAEIEFSVLSRLRSNGSPTRRLSGGKSMPW